MGQRIPDDLRKKIRHKCAVREVTAEHIIFADGRVIDPSQFLVEQRRARFVVKLTKCGCIFKRHHIGQHMVVSGRLELYANGREIPHLVYPSFCRNGAWILEEVLK